MDIGSHNTEDAITVEPRRGVCRIDTIGLYGYCA